MLVGQKSGRWKLFSRNFCLYLAANYKQKNTIMDATYMELVVRLTLAMVLGGAIGIEREYRAKEAGFRTHFLVADLCSVEER